MKKKILISTGGSGGHVIPAKILLDHLFNSFEVIISTDQRGEKFLENTSIRKIKIYTPKLDNLYLLPLNLVKILILTIMSIFISTVGYMSLPLCLAAKLLFIIIYLFEPNMVLGRANTFFLKFSEKILCYSKLLKKFPNKYLNKIVLIDPLVRAIFYEKKKKITKNDKFNFLV